MRSPGVSREPTDGRLPAADPLWRLRCSAMNGSARRTDVRAGGSEGHDRAEAPMHAAGDWSPPAASSGSAPRFQDTYPAVPDSVAAVRAALQSFAARTGVPRDTVEA